MGGWGARRRKIDVMPSHVGYSPASVITWPMADWFRSDCSRRLLGGLTDLGSTQYAWSRERLPNERPGKLHHDESRVNEPRYLLSAHPAYRWGYMHQRLQPKIESNVTDSLCPNQGCERHDHTLAERYRRTLSLSWLVNRSVGSTLIYLVVMTVKY